MSDVAGKGGIIRDAENQKEMIEKLEARYEEQLKKVLERRNATTEEELIKEAGSRITKRQDRTSGDHKALKDRTVLVNPASKDIENLRKTLDKETAEVAKRVLSELPAEQRASLMGRVTFGVKSGGSEGTGSAPAA